MVWHPEIHPTRFMRWLVKSGIQFKFHDLHKNQPTDYKRFYTANISLKREFLGSERFDNRLQKKGMQLLYYPEAVAQHLHIIDAKSLKKRQFEAGKNAYRFSQIHPEANILPSGGKLFLQKIFAYAFPFTYYAKAKASYLAGIAEARLQPLK